MRRIPVLLTINLVIFLLTPMNTHAQEGWVSQTSNTTSFLLGVSFFDANNGVAVGTGVINWTTNGGLTWLSQPSAYILYSVSMIDPNTALAVGSSGIILRTTTGGTTWTGQTSGTAVDLHGVSFSDDHNGTVVGGSGVILHSTDGGATWQPQTSGTSDNLYGVSFVNPTTGFAVGGFTTGVILKTTDGGTTWQQQPSGVSAILTAVSAVDENNVTVVGSNRTILRTTHGGTTWVSQSSGGGPLAIFYGVCCMDSIVAFASGGGILKTTDAGTTWVPQQLSANIRAVHMLNSLTGTAVGESGSIFHTSTGGTFGWVKQASGTTMTLWDIAFSNMNQGIAVGDSGITCTTDGGVSWLSQPIVIARRLYGVCSPAENMYIVVGDSGTIGKTTDGGQTWESLSSGTFARLNSVHFVDMNVGYVGGMSVGLKTTDGGLTWLTQSFSTGVWGSISFQEPDRGIAVGSPPIGQGIIRWTTNGGLNWSPPTLGMGNFRPNGGVMLGPLNTVAVGNGIRRSTDGGMTWSDVLSTNSLYAVSFVGFEIGTAVGLGSIYRTTSGGLQWTRQYGSQGRLNGVVQVTSTLSIAVGEEGAIYRTTTGGVFTDVRTAPAPIPETHLLEQNYPNPFNPSTTIQFTLPRAGFTRLAVYDVLGAEVAALVAAELPTGVHSVRWDASGKSSGVYFYRLETGTYVETKKLILLR